MNQEATSTQNTIKKRLADFSTLTAALDYAATGITGANFYNARGNLTAVLPYSKLREKALEYARKLNNLGLNRGDHVALVAETEPEFIILFFACQYAGMVPYAMPVPTNLGSHKVYVQQLRRLLTAGEAKAAIANGDLISFLQEACNGLGLRWVGAFEQLVDIPCAESTLIPNLPDEPAYLQFTSGSTRFPRGVVITNNAVINNIRYSLCWLYQEDNNDRGISWLPFYHDMGLVGFVLSPIAGQGSVDYLPTRAFAIRPLQWLRLISRNRCSISFSPPIGYFLCTQRIHSDDLETLDLSCWRVAGVGAEMIRADILENFADTMKSVGFDTRAFMPSYGLAEVSLAASLTDLNSGFSVMSVDALAMAEREIAVPVMNKNNKVNHFVNCGRVFPGHAIKIVNDQYQKLPDLHVGRVLIKGPSLMSGYFNADDASSDTTLLNDGWLDTGDLGYICQESLYITGRRKDLIIVNGRNIRPEDLEAIAEEEPKIRTGETCAFDIVEDEQRVVLVVECRITDTNEIEELIKRLQKRIYEWHGIYTHVEIAAPRTLPRTSSGKLSRSAAREQFRELANQIKVTTNESEPT